VIRSLKVSNFQAHKDSEINFTPGLNVLVGKSDSGKSSILRCLSFLQEGKPTGFSFASHWLGHGGKVEARIDYDDGYVYRSKSKSSNEWDCNGTILKATGQGVPEEVAQLANWSEVNRCGQHDSMFLIEDSNGQVAKRLNELVNLDIIDRSIGNASKDVKQNKASIDSKQEQIRSIDEQLEQFKDLKKTNKEFELLKELECQYIKLDDFYLDLKNSLKTLSELESKMSKFNGVDEALSEVDQLLIEIEEKERLESKRNFLARSLKSVIEKHNQIKGYGDLEGALSECNSLIAESEVIKELESSQNGLKSFLQGIEATEDKLAGFSLLEEAHLEIIELLGMVDALEKKRVEKDSFETQVGKIKSLAANVESAKNELVVLENEFKEALGEACPLCEQRIGE